MDYVCRAESLVKHLSANRIAADRGRPESEAPLCRYLADKANVVVVAPDYWKAPSE